MGGVQALRRSGSRTVIKTITGRLLRDRALYLMLIPGTLFYAVFKYWPMYGVVIAFKDFSIPKGILGSPWVGLKHFASFFESPNAWQLIRNTVLLNLYGLVFVFPAPIILASLFNELRLLPFKRVVQTLSYLPHFVSTVVIAGMVINFLSPSTGVVNQVLVRVFGLREPIFFMADPAWFRPVYIASEIWQKAGWGTIMYLAALSGVNPELYDAACIDGAGRWQRYRHVTFVSMVPVMTVMLILDIGHMLKLGFEKIILLYNPLNYETADVIGSYIYRQGLLQADYSYAAAVGFFESVIGLALLVSANRFARRTTENSLW